MTGPDFLIFVLLFVSCDSELDQNFSGDFRKTFSSDLNEIWYVGRGKGSRPSVPHGTNFTEIVLVFVRFLCQNLSFYFVLVFWITIILILVLVLIFVTKITLDIRQHHRLMPLPITGWGHNNTFVSRREVCRFKGSVVAYRKSVKLNELMKRYAYHLIGGNGLLLHGKIIRTEQFELWQRTTV